MLLNSTRSGESSFGNILLPRDPLVGIWGTGLDAFGGSGRFPRPKIDDVAIVEAVLEVVLGEDGKYLDSVSLSLWNGSLIF